MSAEGQATMRGDDVVLWLVIVFCLSVPVVLVIHWTLTDTLYPPMLVSILLGIGTAALTYRYLGGTRGSEFQVGALKVAGSAAMLLGTAAFTNWGLADQMTKDHGPRTISALEARNRALRDEAENSEQTIRDLQAELEGQTQAAQEGLLQRVAELTPDSFAGRGILDLVNKGSGPFSKVKRSISVNATVTEGPRGVSGFHACSDLGLTNESVRIYASTMEGEVTSERSIEGRQTGRLSTDQCSSRNASFKLRLSCEMGKELFPNRITACTNDGNVGWKDVRASRTFPVSIEVLAQ
jgi:hypothetical protein